jgi:FkbM family methyltransferase
MTNLHSMRRARKTWMRVLRHLHPEITIRVGTKRMRIDLRDQTIAKRLYLGVEWEPELQGLLRVMDLRGSVCLDIGAHIGIHTLLLSELVGPSGRVYAFEPEPHNFSLLEQNLQINGATNVAALCTAAGDVPGRGRLAVNPTNRGDHRLSRGATGTACEVTISTVDEVLEPLPSGTVRFIKIDVQGYEHHVLRGMPRTLQRNPDVILAIEVFPRALRDAGTSAMELIDWLAQVGMIGWEFVPRLLPIQEGWLYELMRERQQVDVIASRNRDLLMTVLGRWYGRPLTAEATR